MQTTNLTLDKQVTKDLNAAGVYGQLTTMHTRGGTAWVRKNPDAPIASTVTEVGRALTEAGYEIRQSEDRQSFVVEAPSQAAVVTVRAREIQAGDEVIGWTSESGEEVDVRDDGGDWIVDGIIVRPEDAPSYRRHRHGEVQVLFADSRMDIGENLPVTVVR